MNLTQFLYILKARYLVALLALGLVVAVALAFSLLLPKSYTATATLIVDSKSKDPVSGAIIPGQLLPTYLATQVDIIKSDNVALRVVENLKLADSPGVREQAAASGMEPRYWLANTLLAKVEVEPSRESSVLRLNFEGADPRFSAAIANAFAQAYIQANMDLRVDPARQTNIWYDEQIKELRGNLEKAQTTLSEYQRAKGLVASDERLDVETARLAELSSQMVVAQSSAIDSRSRQQQSRTDLSEVMSNPLVQGLKIDISRVEAKLSELEERVGVNHPQYLRTQAELDSLRDRLKKEMNTAVSSVSTNARVAAGREGELRAALAAQKGRVLELKQKRDDISVLMRDVENAQRLYDLALQRSGQTRLEAQANLTDIAILSPATPPAKPSSPNTMRNLLIATFLGTLLGIGLALLLEMIDRRVRGPQDMKDLAGIPMLGVMSKAKTGKRNWLMRMPGMKLGGATA